LQPFFRTTHQSFAKHGTFLDFKFCRKKFLIDSRLEENLMKTIFRNLAFGALMAGCAAVSASSSFAQDAPADVCKEVEAKQAVYAQFTSNFDKKEIDKRKTAVDAGKQYIQKYGACADDKAIVDYLNANLPGMEEKIKKEEQAAGEKAIIDRFNNSAKAKNVSEIFASGKELSAIKPDLIDVNITMAAAGFEQTLLNPPVNTYNDQVISQAKTVIQQIEAGKTSTGYGAFTYSCPKDKFPDCKSYTLGAMNYAIGYITYYRQNNKQAALPYFYKSTQYNSFSKVDPTVYQAIGAWYLDEAIKIDKARQEILKTTKTDNEETLAMVANQKGYADRAIDAYSRAYKYAKDDKLQKKEYVDGLYTRLKEIYAFRFDNKVEGIDAYIASVQSKPMPDPTIPITPVKEEAPAPAANTTSSTTTMTPDTTKPTTKPTTNTTAPNTKPATTPAVKKPTSTTTNTSSGTKVSETTVKAGAKKTAPKKKGTR
jgi:hypothetical protein